MSDSLNRYLARHRECPIPVMLGTKAHDHRGGVIPDSRIHVGAASRSLHHRGQATVMVTAGIVFLMGVLGLVVDVGWGYYRKQVAQAAVDSAVLTAVANAGTGTITCGSGGVVCTSGEISCSGATGNLLSGCQYGAINGIPSSKMWINANSGTSSPLSDVTTTYWVSARTSESLTPTFLQVIGVRTGTVAAAATGASVSSGTGTGGGCLYVLDPSAGQALYLNGASLSVTCGVHLNSTSSNALQLNSAAATLVTGTAQFTMAGGGINTGGNGCGCRNAPYSCSGGTTCTVPTLGSAAADPLASVPAPASTACDFVGCSYDGNNWHGGCSSPLSSGKTYCGGISIGGGTVAFSPGTYVLDGGSLTIQGANTTVTGSGVFFYNTKTASSTTAAGSLLLSGQPNVTFTSPTSGAYQGIFLMQDHNVCPSTTHTINGNTNIKINGTLYAHCTKLSGAYAAQKLLYTGQSSTGYYSALVVDAIEINGMSNLVLDPSGGQNTGIGLGSGNKTFLIR